MQSKLSSLGLSFLVTIYCLLPLHSVQGQTRLMYEAFENSSGFSNRWTLESFPATKGWGIVNQAFGGETTYRGTNKLYCAGIGYRGTTSIPYYPDSTSTVLTKTLNFSNLLSARLTFWYKAKIYPGGTEASGGGLSYDMDSEFGTDKLTVSLDGSEIWSSQDVLEDRGTPVNEWTMVDLDLSPDNGIFLDPEDPLHNLEFRFESDNIGQVNPWLWEEFDDDGNAFTNKVYTRGEGIYLDDILLQGNSGYRPDFDFDDVVDILWQTNNPADGSRYAAAWLLKDDYYKQIRASVTVTNLTKNGMTLTVNGDKRTWTNKVSIRTTQILTNKTAGGSATNLLNHVASSPFNLVGHYSGLKTNTVVLEGKIGAPLTVSASAGWCNIKYTTNLFYGENFKAGILWTNKTLKMTNGWEIVGQSDFNFDNQSDILWKHTDGRLTGWLMTNGVYQKSAPINKKIGMGWNLGALADMNNDFQRDFIFQYPATGQLLLWFMRGTNVISSAYVGVTNQARLVAANDFNLDGAKDLLFQKSDGTLSIVYLNGYSLLSPQPNAPFSIGSTDLRLSSAWQIVGCNDFDRDGYMDLLTYNTNGAVSIWYMKRNTVQRYVYLRSGASAPKNWKIVGPK